MEADAPNPEFGQGPVVARRAEAAVGDHGCRNAAGQGGHLLDCGHQLRSIGRVCASRCSCISSATLIAWICTLPGEKVRLWRS